MVCLCREIEWWLETERRLTTLRLPLFRALLAHLLGVTHSYSYRSLMDLLRGFHFVSTFSIRLFTSWFRLFMNVHFFADTDICRVVVCAREFSCTED